MLYKQATMTAVAAIILATSLLLAGFAMPAMAASVTSSAGIVLTKHINNDDGKTTKIDSVQLSARKATSLADGLITVKIVKGDDEKKSANIDVRRLHTTYSTVNAQFGNQVEMIGDFDIVIEYQGKGFIALDSSSVKIVEEGQSDNDDTDTAGDGDDNQNSPPDDDNTPPTTGETISLDKMIGGQHISKADDASTTIKAVEFSARLVLSRTTGTLTVAIVQDDKAFGTFDLSTRKMDTSYKDFKATFDNVKVIGDFDIVFLFEGSGLLKVETGQDNVAGNYFTKSTEFKDLDLVYSLDATSTAGLDTEEDDDNTPPQPPSTGTIKLTVNAIDENGNPVKDMWIEVWQGLTMVNADDPSFTPHTFVLQKGTYTVALQDFEDIKFVKWKDSEKGRYRAATLTSDETFTAIFSTDGSTDTSGNNDTPPSDDDNNPPGAPNTVTVLSQLLDGTSKTGMAVELREAANGHIAQNSFTPATLNMEPGIEYKAIMYPFNDLFFRHWTDGGLHRYHLVDTAHNSGDTLTAQYEQVPASISAHLMINAKTSDGQPIGGTTGSEEDQDLNAEPGLEVLVAPPGSMSAYTAGFTGGSEIADAFHFAKGKTYTVIVQEYGKYKFSHWEDNGSTNRARAVPLNGDLTLTAIFDIVS